MKVCPDLLVKSGVINNQTVYSAALDEQARVCPPADFELIHDKLGSVLRI